MIGAFRYGNKENSQRLVTYPTQKELPKLINKYRKDSYQDQSQKLEMILCREML